MIKFTKHDHGINGHGWGSPDAQVLVPLLARDIQP
jgi:hypothetical protein